METIRKRNTYSFLEGGGEMGELTRSYDWSASTIGTPDQWPHSLRTTVSNLLRSRFPMFLLWGDDMIQFYNDAYRPSLGNEGKHPDALGKRGKDTWTEVWEIIFPLIEQVQTTGEATWMENQLVPIYRNGKIEDVYWTYSYSSVLDDDGNHGGILVTCMETTDAVVAHRKAEESQQELLQLLEASPVAIAKIDNSNDLVFQFANSFYGELVGRKPNEIVGKPLLKALPELKGQGFDVLLKEVIANGKPFLATEVGAEIHRNGKKENIFVDLAYQPRKEKNGETSGVLVVATEVTGQVQARRKIEESEAKLRSILNSAPTAMGVFVGPDLIVENPNQLLIDVMAAGPDIEGKSFRQLLAGLVEEDKKFISLIDSVRSSGQPFEAHEVEVYFKAEKRSRYFNINFIPLHDENNEVYAVLDVSVDVSEQVEIRRKVEESEERFRLLADASPILIWMLQPDGSYGYVNKSTLEFLDVTQERIAALGWQPFIHPDDLDISTQAITKAVQNKALYELEHRLLHKSGEYRWVLSQALPAQDAGGNVFAYVGSSIDIHEAKKSREELQTALEQARLSKEAAEMGTFDMDLETGSMHWDKRCRTLFGISHDRPVSFDHDFIERLHPDDQDRVVEVVRRAYSKHLSQGNYDVEYRTIGAEDGILRWVRAKGKVYFNANDKPVRFIGSVLDITEKVTALQKIEALVEERTKELAEANKELQRSNANLEEFAHAASHDLKEPIRKIHFFTNKLKEQLAGHVSESELRSFTRIENASQRMGSLIDDLLLYSHVSQRPHDTEAVDLNENMHRVLEDLDLDIEEKAAIVNLKNLPVINGYRRQIQQLFQNLLSNALKYSKEGLPPVIDIAAEEVVRDGNQYYLVNVSDNGIGFEQEYAAKIFQMFARLHGKAEYTGTGVGLSIVKKIVENHYGFIEVNSTPGEGSTFGVYFPVIKPK